MNKNLAITNYDSWHKNQSSIYDFYSPWHKMVVEEIVNPKDKNVLEIACGRGELASFLAKNGTKLVAADFSEYAVQLVKNKLKKYSSSKVIQTDIQKIPFNNDYFDIVISCETIEHVENPQKAIEELMRVLKPGGILYLTFPNYFSSLGIYRWYRIITGKGYTEIGQIIYRPVTIFWVMSQLKKMKMKILKISGRNFPLFFPGKVLKPYILPESTYFATKWFAAHAMIIAIKDKK